ncbi:coxsackievirus and adenovirus receptor [Oreochromis niloticus]|uniref:coxsackievirus and adenovirus receptor n=1 Tax=Oreochromis niloticus TaxID=8128 RepID=UPI000394104B|nr:coxsackievirus and adenovirus receptor [Oreochromis niloticus]
MTPLTSLCLCVALLLADLASSEQKTITAESGQKKVTLTCGALNKNIIVVEWSREGLEPEYVLVYRGGKFVSDEQHPSFKNRVDLQDRQMKGGDASLILKDVTINDTGTYKCHVKREGDIYDSMKLNSIIYLRVDPPVQPEHTKDGEKKDIPVERKTSLPFIGHTEDGSKGQMNYVFGSGLFLLLLLLLLFTAAPLCHWSLISRKLSRGSPDKTHQV